MKEMGKLEGTAVETKQPTLKDKLSAQARQLKTDVPAVFLALKAPETPLLAKVLAAVTVAYALSPIDFIPDFIPVLGYLDDVILLPALIALTVKLIPTATFEKYREQAAGLWTKNPDGTDGKPKKWYYAIPIVVIWVLIIWLVVKAVWL